MRKIQKPYTLTSPVGGVPPAGSAGDVGQVDKIVREAGTLELIIYRVYSGAQNTLFLQPRLYIPGGEYLDLFEYASGKAYLDGDDDGWPVPVDIPVPAGSTLTVHYQNTDPLNVHNFRFIFVVDHKGGMDRAESYYYRGVM